MSLFYMVPGTKPVIAQDGPMTCWATVYTMMISWRKNFEMGIREAVGSVAPKYSAIYDQGLSSNKEPKGLPQAEWSPFLQTANMNYEPMKNYPISVWREFLQGYGLLWVGTLDSVGTARHSRIIEGIFGEGQPGNTHFSIIDPDQGRKYTESFGTFLAKYEGALAIEGGQYLQVRHF